MEMLRSAWKMKLNIIYLLLIALLGIIVSASIAQQNQNAPKTDTEVEALRKRVSELENKLQIVENVEKMELAAKLAEAQAKLIDTEFGKLKLELKDSNQQWLITWIIIFLAFLSAGGIALWLRLISKMDDLIADRVEKRLDGFQDSIEQVDTLTNELKEAVEKVNILESQVTILNKEHAADIIEKSIIHFQDEAYYFELIDKVTEEALLDLFNDNTRHISVRGKAIKVLADRKSTKFIFPVLEFLNSTLDSDTYKDAGFETQLELKKLVNYLGMIHTQESYDGLTIFLDRLLLEDTEMEDVYITWTVFSLASAGSALNIGSSVSKMREAIPYLEARFDDKQAFQNLAGYFDKFNEPGGIKEILRDFGLMSSDIKETCLALLEKHDPDFVEQQRAAATTTNTESEDDE
ncbi:hypothetical protein J5I95_08015 [Candidatus Poribacteria bacterium]|nr:hypothetical protein [Candidatus Poribacteria bacterium]